MSLDQPSFPPARAGRRNKGASSTVEVRSIDHVPTAERHGKIWHLAPVWIGANANVATVAVGAVGIAAGGSLFWTLIAVLAGCAFGTVFAALHSTQGPHLGLPQLIQSRPQFGYRGAVLVFVLALATYIGFNVFANVLVAESLQLTVHAPKNLSFLLASVVAGVIALVGYDWIHRVSRWLTAGFLLVFVVLTVVLLGSGDIWKSAFAPGAFAATPFLLQFGVAAGYQINWAIYVSDYTRYLPETVSPRRMFWMTYLSMTVSAVWLAGLGSVLTTAFNQLDAIGAVAAAGDLVFTGFGNTAVLILLIGMMISATMNTYGGALTLISIIDSVRPVHSTRKLRMISVTIVTVVTLALSFVASSDFLATFGAFLTVMLYLFAPWTAINLTDYFLVRRGHYSVTEMFNAHGIYGRWNTRGLLAYAIGFIAEIPFMNVAFFQGPVSSSLGGADVSAFIGLAVGALAYLIMYRRHDQAAEDQSIAANDIREGVDRQKTLRSTDYVAPKIAKHFDSTQSARD
jgi:purine-cytosine permease-like protein